MGIDPSLNSTGVCIWNGVRNVYYLLAAHTTKKMAEISSQIENITIVNIPKEHLEGSGTQQAISQTKNITAIVRELLGLLDMHKPNRVVIEAPAFGASGRVADLAGLNHIIRYECYRRGIDFYPLPPTAVKMQTVGNGQATKEMMVDTWLMIEPAAAPLRSCKCDDLADAWALCHYPL